MMASRLLAAQSAGPFSNPNPFDDVFEKGFGIGAPNDLMKIPMPEKFGASSGFDVQRASLATTECPSNFSDGGFDIATPYSFDSVGAGSGGPAPPLLFAAAEHDGVFATSAFARRAQSIAKASAAPIAPPPFAPPPPPPGLGFERAILPLESEPSPVPSLAADEEEDDMPSVGAKLHASGACTPCKFFRGRRGCKDGKDCALCHHKHDELTYSGIRRMMRKKALATLEESAATAAVADAPASSAPTMAWRPPPGLPEPDRGFAPWGTMTAAYMGIGARI